MSDIPRGKFIGERVDDEPSNEAEHFMRCPACGGWIDMRDLGQVFDHARCRIQPVTNRNEARPGRAPCPIGWSDGKPRATW
jgi:hypothetical protein